MFLLIVVFGSNLPLVLSTKSFGLSVSIYVYKRQRKIEEEVENKRRVRDRGVKMTTGEETQLLFK